MADSSFDIVSKIDHQEVDNAINQAATEVRQRFDFKNTGAEIARSGDQGVEISANADDRARAVLDVFKEKLIKRQQSLKILEAGEPRQSGRRPRSPSPSRRASPGAGQEGRQADPRRGTQGRQGPGAGRRAPGDQQEARRPAGGDRPGEGAGLRLRGAVHQLPLNPWAAVEIQAPQMNGGPGASPL